MMRTILVAWIIFAGLATVVLGGCICTRYPLIGVTMMISGAGLLGLAGALIREVTRRSVVSQPVTALGQVLPAASRSSHRDRRVGQRDAA